MLDFQTFFFKWFSNNNAQREIRLTPITRRQNKRPHDDGEEPSFNQIMLMITNQQMNEMRERAADREDQREERRLCLEEQREDRLMQFQMQQQMMTTMMMLMGGGNMLSRQGLNIPNNPSMQQNNINEDGKEEETKETEQ